MQRDDLEAMLAEIEGGAAPVEETAPLGAAPAGSDVEDMLSQIEASTGAKTPTTSTEETPPAEEGGVLDALASIIKLGSPATMGQGMHEIATGESPVDPLAGLRLFQTVPNISSEFGSILAGSQERADLGERSLDYLLGLREEAPTVEEARKLAATTEDPFAHAGIAGLEALSEFAALPTGASLTGESLDLIRKLLPKTERAVAKPVEELLEPQQLQLPLKTGDEAGLDGKLMPEQVKEPVPDGGGSQLELEMKAMPEKPIEDLTEAEFRQLPEGSFGRMIADKMDKFGRWVGDRTIRRSVSHAYDMGEFSPTWKAIAEDIEWQPLTGKAVEKDDFTVAVAKAVGPITRQMEEVLDLVPRKELNNVGVLLRGGKASTTLKPAAFALRKLLNDAHNYFGEAWQAAGGRIEDIKYLKNFFPRVWNRKAVEGRGNELYQVFVDHGIAGDEASKIVVALQRGGASLMDLSGVADDAGVTFNRASHLETMRKLHEIPEEALIKAGFIEANPRVVLTQYLQELTRRAEWIRRFGISGEKLIADLNRAGKEAQRAGVPVREIEQARTRTIRLVNALQGNDRVIETPLARKATRVLLTYQYMRTLSLVTLSSIAEPLIIWSRAGLGATLRGLPDALEHAATEATRIIVKSKDKASLTKFIEDIGVGLDEASLQRLTDAFGSGNASLETAIGQKFFKLNGLAQWTRFNRAFAASVMRQAVKRDAERLVRGGRGAVKAKARLLDIGLEPAAVEEWARRGMKEGDAFFNDAVRAAAVRFVNDTVMHPRPAVKPMWMNDPHFALIGQLKGFQMTFGNTVLYRWYKETARALSLKDPVAAQQFINKAGTIMAMMMTMYFVNDLKDKMRLTDAEYRKRKRNETHEEKVFRAVDSLGFLGPSQFLIDAYQSSKYGRSPLASMLGPTAAQLESAVTAAERGDGKRVLREAIPIVSQNQDLQEILGLRK